MGTTHFLNLQSNGVPTMGIAGAPMFTGNWYWVDPANGSDSNLGTSPGAGNAFATLYKAHSSMTAGNNDVCVLVGNGAASGTARLSTALAQSVDSSVMAGTLNWTKNACHLIGMTAPTMNFQRARIAPPSGTYTVTTFGSANFVVVTGVGCYFANFSLFNGFSTGGAAQICWTDTGGRNYYNNVNFGGMADAGSANSTTSRSLLIGSGGTGENTFENCTIGIDTVTRTAANASLEFAGSTPRNVFRNCLFPVQTSSAGALCITSSSMDRFQLFDGCTFVNNTKSTSTTMTALCTLGAATGGMVILKNCLTVGMTDLFTDATTAGQMFIDMPAPSNSAGGLGVPPA